MEFDNSFEVPLPPEQAWAVLMDIRRIAPCMPGAELTDVVDAQTYKGKISVRLGPVALAFAGLVTFEDVDDTNYSARVKAQGTDAKGRGGANAAATFRLESAGTGSRVLVHTDLTLSGAVAQYGRGVGMIQATAAQIIGQFAKNLRTQLTEQQPAPVVPAPPPAPIVRAPPLAPSTPMPQAPPGAAPPAFITRAANRSPIEPPLPPDRPLPPPAAKPISGLSLIARVMWARIVSFLTGNSQR
jgi:carbon monoxide dehydrogenase subunit G